MELINIILSKLALDQTTMSVVKNTLKIEII